MSLLHESRRAYESQMQLQNQLVQKEKLASLGNLIAGPEFTISQVVDPQCAAGWPSGSPAPPAPCLNRSRRR